MGVISTSVDFSDGDQVTSTKLDLISEGSLFTADAISGSTLTVTETGKLQVGTITSSQMGVSSVGASAVIDGSLTPAKLSVGAPTWTISGVTSVVGDIFTGSGISTGPAGAYVGYNRTGTGAAIFAMYVAPGGSAAYYITREGATNANTIVTHIGTGGVFHDATTHTWRSAGGAQRLQIDSAGKLTGEGEALFYGTVTTYGVFTTISDHRLKSDVVPVTSQLEEILRLNPVEYTIANKRKSGFIAHEVQSVFPNAVTGEKDGVDESGNPLYQSIEYDSLICALVAAVQELKFEIETLKKG